MGHHRPSEAGIFDFVDNVRTCMELGEQIAKKIAAIRERINGYHTVGNGNFIALENLRHKQRRAFARILEGLGIIAIAAGAAATIIIASDGCGESGQPDSSVLTDGGGCGTIEISKTNNFLTKINMQNPQRLVFQQSPEEREGMGRENIRNETPEAGTDAKNVVSQAHAKLEHFFEDTTVSQLYKQIQEARKKEDQSFKEKGFVSAEESNAIFHMMEELVQLTPRNEEEKDIVLEQIDYIDRNGSQYYAIGPKYNALQDRKKEVEAMQFLTVTDLRDRIGPISRDDPYGAKGIAMREQLIQLTPRTETERRMILEEIAYLNQYGSKYQTGDRDTQKNQVALDKRRKEVESLKFN